MACFSEMLRNTDDNEKDIYDLGKEKVAPVLYSYVQWILTEAHERNINTLYFLARDGYVLKTIAELICEKENLKIECKYLYCSRKSLRIPTYAFIGEEAWDLIFLGGYAVTLASFFERVDLPQEEWDKVIEESGIDVKTDRHKILGDSEINEYRVKLCGNPRFKNYVSSKAEAEYPYAIAYFRQEGLFDQETVAIVDSGWTGSMQRSLRQLLSSDGWNGNLVGFYFGMYVQPKPEDGDYLTYYFSKRTGKLNKVLFCNNLFECFLSAPHGMTTGYRNRLESNLIEPVCNNSDNKDQQRMIDNQIDGIISGVNYLLEEEWKYTKAMCQKILRSVMAHPTWQTVQTYGRFLFCDDITEKYKMVLVSECQVIELRNELLTKRLLSKLLRRNQPKMLWEYGAVAYVKNPAKRCWYWINIFAWNCLRYFLIQ